MTPLIENEVYVGQKVVGRHAVADNNKLCLIIKENKNLIRGRVLVRYVGRRKTKWLCRSCLRTPEQAIRDAVDRESPNH